MSIANLLQNISEGNAESAARRDVYDQMTSAAISNMMESRVARRSASGGRGGSGSSNKGGSKGGGSNQSANMPYVPGQRGAFLESIATQESGGSNYGAKGVVVSSGDRAYGKYQIMGANFLGPGGWDKEALGRDISLQRYMNTPRVQERIARSKLTDYFRKYGPAGAAKSWYAGESNAYTNSDSSQYGGPSINDYASEVVNRMRDIMRRRRR